MLIIIIIRFFINVQVQEHPQQWAPFQVAGLLHSWQISHQISRCLYHEGRLSESVHSLQSLSDSCFQVIFGLTGPNFPSTCISKAVLTALLVHSMCLCQGNLFFFSMRFRSSMPSPANGSVDLMVPGRVAQSVGHLARKSRVLGLIPGLATYFRFYFRFFKKGSCQLLAKVCARSTG